MGPRDRLIYQLDLEGAGAASASGGAFPALERASSVAGKRHSEYAGEGEPPSREGKTTSHLPVRSPTVASLPVWLVRVAKALATTSACDEQAVVVRWMKGRAPFGSLDSLVDSGPSRLEGFVAGLSVALQSSIASGESTRGVAREMRACACAGLRPRDQCSGAGAILEGLRGGP